VAQQSPITRGARRSKLAPGSRLAPEVVRASQRERLTIALIEVVDHQGLPDTTVAHLTERAHVSRAAFYEQFTSLQHCFLATYDTHLARVLARVLPAYETPDSSWHARIETALGALAAELEAWPAAARVCVADILTTGPAAQGRNAQALALARRVLRDASAAAGGESPRAVSEPAAVALAGGVRRVIQDGLRASRQAHPPDLERELTAWLLSCLPSAPAAIQSGAAEPIPADARQPPHADTAAAENGRRERILAAVTELASTKGYDAMSHRDIAGLAKVSYSTFYSQFENKQTALLAACDLAHERLMSEIPPALAATRTAAGDWPRGVSAAIAAYLRAAATHPREARLLGVELYRLGHPGLELADRHAGDFERLLAPGYELRPETSRTTAVAFAGAMLEALRHYAATERIAELPSAGPELTYVALAPLLGPEEASQIGGVKTRT
jgi:AcrR family transcriptional regulator